MFSPVGLKKAKKRMRLRSRSASAAVLPGFPSVQVMVLSVQWGSVVDSRSALVINFKASFETKPDKDPSEMVFTASC